MSVDPVTFEVIRHRLLGITDEQASKLRAISGSKNVTEMSDFNVGLYLADGSVATMGRTLLFHASSIALMARHVIEDCSENPGIEPGDMFVVNNPWKGAMHGPDMAILAPVFHEGKLILWSGAMMHMADIGSMRPGGYGMDATDTFQEGLQFPPTKLVEHGVLRRDVWNLILTHTRMAPAMSLDLKGLMAANHAAAEGFDKLINRYGADTVIEVMASLIELSEERLRRRLRELPNGTVEAIGYLEYEESIKAVPTITLELTKKDDRLIFDYSRSSPQLDNAMNCTWAGLRAGICSSLLPTLAYNIPWNQGLFNSIEIVCPEGLVCNARRPAAVSGNIAGAVWEAAQTAILALSKLAACSDTYIREAQASACGRPGSMNFFGINQHGETFSGSTLDVLSSGGGAYSHHDGLYTQGHHDIERVVVSNIEALELDLPMIYLWRGLARDGGGAGRRRGGLSLGGVYKPHKVATLQSRPGRAWEVPDAPGVFGGYPGAQNNRILKRLTDVEQQLRAGHVPSFQELSGDVDPIKDPHAPLHLNPDDVVLGIPPAAAGWGDPLDRDLDDVEHDLTFGAISADAARDVYSVVLDVAGRVDRQATEIHREHLRQARREWPSLKRLDTAPPATDLERVCPMGDQLEIVRDRRGGAWTRCRCGHLLAPAGERWREYAGRNVARQEEIGPWVVVHATMQVRRYACPGCGRLHAVDVVPEGAPDLHDIRLEL